MKIKIQIIILFSVCFIYGQAQTSFQKVFGGVQDENLCGLLQTNDDGYLITGSTTVAGTTKGWIIKINNIGTTLWNRTLGSNCFGACEVSGGDLVVGVNSAIANNLKIVKLTPVGDTVWTKNIGSGTGKSIHNTADGGFIISCSYNDVGTGFEGPRLIRTNNVGTILWSKNYLVDFYTEVNEARETTDGGIIAIGDGYINPLTHSNVILFKTDMNGSIQWYEALSGDGYNFANDVRELPNNDFIACGFYDEFTGGTGGSDLYLFRTKSNGDTLWTGIYDKINSDAAISVEPMSDGFVIGGYASPILSQADVVLVKTDTLGNIQWSKLYGGSNQDLGKKMIKASDGSFLIGGNTNSFGSGAADLYIVKTDTLGNSGCNASNIIMNRMYFPTTIFYPSPIVNSIFTNYSTPLLIDSLLTESTLCLTVPVLEEDYNENSLTSKIKLYPNPFTNVATMQFDNSKKQNCTLTLYDLRGQVVQTIKNITADKVEIERQSLASGLYFFQLRTDRQIIATGKLAIE